MEKRAAKIVMKLMIALGIFILTYFVLWGSIRAFMVFESSRPVTPISEFVPWGIWESHDPPLVLYIMPEFMSTEDVYIFPAFFRTDYENAEVLVSFFSEPPFIGLRHRNIMHFNGGGLVIDGSTFTFSTERFYIDEGVLYVGYWLGGRLIFYPAVDIRAGCIPCNAPTRNHGIQHENLLHPITMRSLFERTQLC